MQAPRVCVAGAGAVGGLIAAKLARAGFPVSVLARGEHWRAIEARGLTLLEGEAGAPVHVASANEPAALGPQDVVFIALKAPSLVEAASSLKPLLTPDTVLVPAMNGVPWWFFHRFGGALAGTRLASVDPGGVISEALPAEQVIGSVVHLSSSIAGRGSSAAGSATCSSSASRPGSEATDWRASRKCWKPEALPSRRLRRSSARCGSSSGAI